MAIKIDWQRRSLQHYDPMSRVLADRGRRMLSVSGSRDMIGARLTSCTAGRALGQTYLQGRKRLAPRKLRWANARCQRHQELRRLCVVGLETLDTNRRCSCGDIGRPVGVQARDHTLVARKSQNTKFTCTRRRRYLYRHSIIWYIPSSQPLSTQLTSHRVQFGRRG
jgi:hypothetical protein